jgi:hypothetical protein
MPWCNIIKIPFRSMAACDGFPVEAGLPRA